MGMKTALLNYEQIVHVLKYGAFAMPVGALSSMCGRIGFICFLLLSVITVYRLWSLVVTQLVVNVVPIILEFTTCKPVSKLWNFMGEGICEEAIVAQRMGYFQGGKFCYYFDASFPGVFLSDWVCRGKWTDRPAAHSPRSVCG
jgi:hypothetical protein